ncbi:MAG TPA: CheR family methyltransferase [Steroidobacteraceae bacterium]|jgi:chemotaxis protein methyltransferase CheR
MQIDAVPDALWRRVSEFIGQNTGLDFPGERRSDLQRGLAAAAAEFGLADAASCADWLLSGSPTRSQLHVVASHLTIGETYFFRERKTFDALAEHVLPELIRRRRGREQRLRLWSAACSTGEEPYSLAILVRQLLPDWQDWNVKILATDINERFLQKAIAGVYGEWSFRESAIGFKERHFTATSNGRFAIAPEIRNCVSFAHMNLAQDCFPSPTSDTQDMDIIFCRNVLIYFTASHARKLAENVRHALAEGGWLAVSPSECSQTLFSRFAAVNFPGTILYRKCKAEERGPPIWLPPSDAVAERAAAAFDASQPLTSYARDRHPETARTSYVPDRHPGTAGAPPTPVVEAAAQTSPATSQLAEKPGAFSLRTRALANQGQYAAALASSKQWIASDKVDSAAHYVHAMIMQEMGEREAARDSLQRAVYLQPDFVLAHFALGNLARAEARTAQANKHFANALHLLRSCPPDALLPESDGMSAGRLAEIVTTLLAQPDRLSTPEAPPNDRR